MKNIICKLTIISFLTVYSLASAAFEPIQTNFLWKSDLNVGPKADFLVKLEPRKIDEHAFGIVNYLKIYGEENNSLFLAHEEKDVGEILAIFHVGQVDSPLITVTTKMGKFFDVRGYYYDEGRVKKGFEFSSTSFPEVVIRKSGGVYIIARFLNEKYELVTKTFFYFSKNWAEYPGEVPLEERLTRVQRSSNY